MKNSNIFKGLPNKEMAECFADIKTPAYVIDEARLIENAKILKNVIEHTGCKILLAQKAFSNYDFYPVLSKYLSGTEASGLYEARLGAEKMPEGEVHVFCAAYSDDEFQELLNYADHIVFNSINQLKRFGELAKNKGKSIGLRINPECSTQEGHEIYDPCAKGSRLGVTRKIWDRDMTDELFAMLDGLHFHTLCEQDSDALEITLAAVDNKFGDVLSHMKWLNMGGGHHITKEGYDVERLERLILLVKEEWNVEVYLEPGEAVALNAGYFVSQVLDIVENEDVKIAILNASAACHMPDVIEMPYTPPLFGGENNELIQEDDLSNRKDNELVQEDDLSNRKDNDLTQEDKMDIERFVYRLAGPTCLSGDYIGEYSFEKELKINDYLVFGDMAIYTTCKNNTFNGMPLPNIYRMDVEGEFEKLTDFGYEDFKGRLGKYEKNN